MHLFFIFDFFLLKDVGGYIGENGR